MTRDELYREELQRLRAELDLTKRQLDTVLRLLGKEIEKRATGTPTQGEIR